MLVKIKKDNVILKVEDLEVKSYVSRGFELVSTLKNEIKEEHNEKVEIVGEVDTPKETLKGKPGRKSKKSV